MEAIENADLLSIHYDEVYALLDLYPDYEKHYRRLLERITLNGIRRVESLINLTATERYDVFRGASHNWYNACPTD